MATLDAADDPLLQPLARAAAAACAATVALIVGSGDDGPCVAAWSDDHAGGAAPARLARSALPALRAIAMGHTGADDGFEVPEVAFEPAVRDVLERAGLAGIRSLVGWPLRPLGAGAVGMLWLLRREPGRLEGAPRIVLGHLAQAVAEALAREQAVRRRAPRERPERFGDVAVGDAADVRTSRHHLNRLIAGLHAGVWEYNLRTGQVLLNRACLQIVGEDAREGLWTTQDACLERIHPDDIGKVQEQLRRYLAAETGQFECEMRLRHRDGRWVWVREQGQVMARGADGRPEWLCGTRLDIDAQLSAQREAHRNAEVLLSAIDALDEAFVLYDPQDRLVLCNEKYRSLYATSADLLVPGASFEDIVREGARRGQYVEAVGRIEAWVAERMVAHRSGNTTLVQRIDDGRTLRILERKTPDGHLVGFRIDITDLVRAKEQAEEGNRAKGEFIATVSHELRTPLTSILGFAELGEQIAQSQHDARFQRMFGRIHNGAYRMIALVNDLLDLSDRGAAATPLNKVRADLGHLLRDVVVELQPQLDARALAVDGLATLPPLPVVVDPLRCQQVLRNVLANAIRFAPPASTIDIDAPTSPGADTAVLTVRDRGPGIPEAELESIFEAFVQSSRTRDGSGGTGLGLAICRRLMTAHGGSIHAENAAGGGARIHLRWPAADSMDARVSGT